MAVLARLFAGGGLQPTKVALVDRNPKACSQWLQDNWGLFKGIAHVRLLLVVLWAAVVVAIKEHVVDEFAEDEDEVFPLLSSPASRSGVGVLGSLLAFALVFRTSICYTRWWEARRLPSPNARRHSPATPVSWHLPTPRARPRLPPSAPQARCLWGLMIYAAINLSQQTNRWMHEGALELASRASRMLMVFVNACATHLRNTCRQGVQHAPRRRGHPEELELQIICTCRPALTTRLTCCARCPPSPHAPRPPPPPPPPHTHTLARPRPPHPPPPNAPPPSPIPGDRQGLLDARLPASQLERGHEGGGVRAHGEHHRRPRQGHRRHSDQGDGLPYSYDSSSSRSSTASTRHDRLRSMMCVAPPRPTHASLRRPRCAAPAPRAGGTGQGRRPSSCAIADDDAVEWARYEDPFERRHRHPLGSWAEQPACGGGQRLAAASWPRPASASRASTRRRRRQRRPVQRGWRAGPRLVACTATS